MVTASIFFLICGEIFIKYLTVTLYKNSGYENES